MNNILTIDSLSKYYGHQKALDNLSLHVPKGAIYGLVGTNGAGKTTLIRIISGLQRPTSGSYSLYDTDYSKKEIGKTRSRMGAIVETPALYTDMTAVENLKAQYRILGMPTYDGIEDILELVGLNQTGRKKVRNFSLGMRQRLGIAVALAGNPDFLVLDEPINGLDPQGIVEIRELILNLNREHQITFFISSHMLDELSRVATHYGFISEGHMIKEISANELEDICCKCIRIEVSDIKVLTPVLDTLSIEYKVISNQIADLFSPVNISKLSILLDKENCELISVKERTESLESYYISLIGGKNYES